MTFLTLLPRFEIRDSQGNRHFRRSRTRCATGRRSGHPEVKELCELLRIHPSTLYKLLRQGKIPSFRVGNEWRFRKDAIMRWLSEKSVG